MTLEDFFTLAEMKDGLTASARVRELVNVIQNERDCAVKNVGDATRQWSTVASTIAATDDKECLDLFVQLDGIGFIDRWLKDAESCIGDTSYSFVEESMTSLLCALLKLNVDYEKAMSCGIWLTVKNLLDHSSTKIRDKARALFDSWKQDGSGDTVPQDVDKVKAPDTDLKQADSGLEDSRGSTKDVESAKVEAVPSSNSGVPQPESSVDVEMQTSDKAMTCDNEVMKEDCTLQHVSPSVMLDPVKESSSTGEQPPGFEIDETKEIGSHTSTIPDHGFEGKADATESNEFPVKSEEEKTSLPSKLGSMLISSVSTPLDARQSVTGAELQNEKQDSSVKGCDMDMAMVEEKKEKCDAGSPDYCRSMVTANQGRHSDSNVSLEYSGNESKSLKQGSDTSFSSEDSGTSSREKEHASDESEDLAMRAKDREVDKRSSFAELDYGMVDALEVARQVAIEVEREVTNCGEPSGSSSERTSDVARDVVARQVAIGVERKVMMGHGAPSGCSSERISDVAPRQPESAESVSIKATSKEAPPGSNLSPETSAKRVEISSSLKALDAAERENRLQDLESSQVTEAAQERGASSERGFGNFDLNQEVSSEDMDRYPASPAAASIPISVVSASRAAAGPGLPVAPLQFEGALGWKGSAATSAFRRVSEGSSSSKQRGEFLDFDLNVAEIGEEPVNLIPGKTTNLAISGLPFGNSTIQARSERLKLDLNLTSDDGDAPIDSRMVHPKHSRRNLSPSSSSSSMQQPTLKNFDLNDQPSLYNDSLDLQYSRGKPSSQSFNADAGGFRPANPVISIFGTKVEVNRKDSVPQFPSLPNGNAAFDAGFGRSGGVSGMGSAVQFGHHPHLFGYNGPAVAFSSSMYGPPVHYMVDSRGVPVAPQLMGSPAASLSAYPRPFVMGMMGTPPGPNGPGGPSQHNFDLGSGLMIDEGNRQSGVLRQLLDPGQNRPMDEHLRVNTQPFLGPSGFGKRKEPEDGWEPYPHYRNHRQPPWN